MGFAKSLFTTKIRNLHDTTIKLIAKWDPESVGEAQLEEWNTQARTLAESAAQAQLEAKTAAETVTNIKSNFERYRSAAEKLESANPVAAEKAANQALEWHEKITDAETEAKEAEEWAKEVLNAAERAQTVVLEGRERIAKAKREQERAQRDAQVAESRRKDRERIAGISTGLDGANIAIDAMSANAKDARQKAAADNIRSNVLGKAVEDDNAIIEALKEVDGDAKPKTLAEKMAALRSK